MTTFELILSSLGGAGGLAVAVKWVADRVRAHQKRMQVEAEAEKVRAEAERAEAEAERSREDSVRFEAQEAALRAVSDQKTQATVLSMFRELRQQKNAQQEEIRSARTEIQSAFHEIAGLKLLVEECERSRAFDRETHERAQEERRAAEADLRRMLSECRDQHAEKDTQVAVLMHANESYRATVSEMVDRISRLEAASNRSA